MGTATILELATDIAIALNVARPAAVVGATTDLTALKILRFITHSCRDMAGRYDWQELRREKAFTTTSGADVQANAVATDLLRFIPGSMWNRTTTWQVMGPMTPDEWQAYKAQVTSRVYDAFRLRGNALLLAPQPTGSETIAYEYITKYIGLATDGTTERLAFAADTDTTYFDDELIIQHTVWRHRKSEGLDYSEEFRAAEMRFQQLTRADGGKRTIDMAGGCTDRKPMAPRVPDTLLGLS